MIELRFHAELYDAAALEEAVKTYEPYAALTLTKDPGGFIVTVAKSPAAGDDAADPALVAAELMNFALGQTIERSRAAGAAAAPAPAPAKEAA